MVALCGMLGLFAPAAWAQPVELPVGSVVGNARMRGMGGAFTGVAESTSAMQVNPAAMAIRNPGRNPQWAQAEFATLIREHPLVRRFEERIGLVGPTRSALSLRAKWQAGFSARLGPAALSLGVRDHAWSTPQGILGATTYSLGGGMSGATWAVGVLPELVVARTPDRQSLGVGGSIGGLWAPRSSPIRLGARARLPTATADIHVPAQLAAGISIGTSTNEPGPYGIERREGTQGTVLIVSADVVWTEAADEAVPLGALQPTWRGTATPSDASVAFHAGSELRTLDQTVRFRLGGYTIPGRGHGPTRWRATAGAAVELLEMPSGRGLRAAVSAETGQGNTSITLGFEGG